MENEKGREEGRRKEGKNVLIGSTGVPYNHIKMIVFNNSSQHGGKKSRYARPQYS